MNDYIKGFIMGIIFVLTSAIIVSCTITPLEADVMQLGATQYNPLYVKIVE